MRHFCTYFDSGYLSRAMVLHQSLARHAAPFTLWVLCFDEAAHRILKEMALPGVVPIGLEEVEDDALRAVKPSRSRVEYYFTCTPSFILFLLRTHPQIEILYYVDADLMFFADPVVIERELGDGAVFIVEHGFRDGGDSARKHGTYNVGLVGFRNDDRARACATWWRERCLEWCYDRYEEGRYADQKYLDTWPERFEGVMVSRNLGVGVGPWNLANHPVSLQNGTVCIATAPLVFFHYHGLRRLWHGLYDPNIGAYGVRFTRSIRDGIFVPYVAALRANERALAPYTASLRIAGVSRIRARGRLPLWKHAWRRVLEALVFCRSLLSGQLLWYPGR